MKFIKDVYSLFFPNVCAICKENLQTEEHVFCLKCSFQLPLTNYIDEKDNKVEKTFYGRVPLEYGAALFFYAHGNITQKIMYQLKYHNAQHIGTFLGNWMGNILKESARFPKVDCILPVPLHRKKLRKRGYNQLTTFGKALAEILQVPFIENELIRTTGSATQTRKNRIERWRNVQEIFSVKNTGIFNNKHLLLIDDVITTGSTLESCAMTLLQSENVKISIVTMAFTE